jgi:hypothetical protein
MFMPLSCWVGMKDNADILHTRLERLLELAELARHTSPEDRARIDRTIRLVIQGLRAIAQAREALQRAALLTKEAEARMVHRQSDHDPK